MKLYKETEKPLQWKPSVQVRAKELATLDDLRKALAEHGLVAVPKEPTTSMITAMGGQLINGDDNLNRMIQRGYQAMIQAAEGRSNGTNKPKEQ